ncbi:hypothetical protein BG015_003291 [Linnemannia schmuckeri]|uniref:F-box domain-containing protein n=1 Tax=Linnemannia schmuckeri TaxID=64567 RepID=A0A9P5RLA1_9FUNG|nr:hypothetical protein BG015_003291 [Linnemannia schmuckeri]
MTTHHQPTTSTGDHAPNKILIIPELVQRIAHSLDSKTIVACARVNKAWHSIWLPILWHTIDAGRQWHNPGFLSALHQHADLIRNLKCSRYDDIRLLFNSSPSSSPTLESSPLAVEQANSGAESGPSVGGAAGLVGAKEQVLCKNLITLVLPKTTLTNQADQARLLRLNPNLLDLSITLHDNPSSKYTDLIEAVCSLPMLRRLALDENKTLEAKTLETFLSRLNCTLQELSLKSTFFVKHPFGSGEDFAASAGTKESYGIQSLCMDGVACSQDFLLHLASRFPSLTHFSLGDSAEVYIDDNFGEKLARLCPQLKSIDISLLDNMDDESIASLIRALPRLQKFRAAETRFGNRSLEALVEDGRDLSILDINTTYVTESSGIQRLLERSGALTKLDAWELSVNVPEMMSEAYGTRVSNSASRTDAGDGDYSRDGVSATALRARASTPTPTTGQLSGERTRGIWGCTGLESLVLGVDYSTDDLTEQERALYPPSKARQFIYEQISRLTNLRYLAIGGAILGGDDEDSGQEDEGVEEDGGAGGGDEANIGDSEDQDDDDDDDDDDEDWTPSADKSSVVKLQKKMAKLEVIDQDSNTLWIEFSLRSGLAILAPLKELRCLSGNQGAHAIGVREVEWMCKNWPRLRSIEGLYEDDAEEAVAWLRKHKPEIELEDDG